MIHYFAFYCWPHCTLNIICVITKFNFSLPFTTSTTYILKKKQVIGSLVTSHKASLVFLCVYFSMSPGGQKRLLPFFVQLFVHYRFIAKPLSEEPKFSLMRTLMTVLIFHNHNPFSVWTKTNSLSMSILYKLNLLSLALTIDMVDSAMVDSAIIILGTTRWEVLWDEMIEALSISQ